MKKHKPYELSDFQRYYFNEMPAEEQHRFEKEMLNDSFLREAYEGFELMLNDGLQPGNWKEKLQPRTPVLKARVRRVWPYAAAASLLTAIGFLFYQRQAFSPEERESVSLPDTVHSDAGITQGIENGLPLPSALGAQPDTISGGRLPAPLKAQTPDSATHIKFSDERLAFSGYGAQSGEVLVVRSFSNLEKNDTLESDQDTIKPRRIYLPDTGRENWEKYIRRATRNSLIYGENIRFGILSLRDSSVRNFTHDEMDELREILRKMDKESTQKKPEISP